MRIYIATPAYGPMDPRAAHSFAIAIADLVAAGHAVRWDIEFQDSNQARARNVLFHRFLVSDFERLLCIDADMVFTSAGIRELLNVGGDAVSGAYRQRAPGGALVGTPLEFRVGDMHEMLRVGFGFLSVSRACIEKLAAAAPRSFIAQTGASAGVAVPEVVATDIAPDGSWLSVDWMFSDRWRSLGGELWLHSAVNVGHVGSHLYAATQEKGEV